MDVKTVSSMLRHSNIKTTLGIYTHVVDSNRLAAQEQFLSTLLNGSQIKSGTKSGMGSGLEGA